MVKKKVRVLPKVSTFTYNGVRYRPGDEILMSAKDCKDFMDIHVVEIVEAPVKPEKKETKEKEETPEEPPTPGPGVGPAELSAGGGEEEEAPSTAGGGKPSKGKTTDS